MTARSIETFVVGNDRMVASPHRMDGDPCLDATHFATCSECLQAYDMRDVEQVLYHMEAGHQPVPLDA